jgi:hypothetical protein
MVPKNEREPGWFPRMRGNPDGSLSSAGASRAPALFPVYRWDFLRISYSMRRLAVDWDQVMAGGAPANPATLVTGLTAT